MIVHQYIEYIASVHKVLLRSKLILQRRYRHCRCKNMALVYATLTQTHTHTCTSNYKFRPTVTGLRIKL